MVEVGERGEVEENLLKVFSPFSLFLSPPFIQYKENNGR